MLPLAGRAIYHHVLPARPSTLSGRADTTRSPVMTPCICDGPCTHAEFVSTWEPRLDEPQRAIGARRKALMKENETDAEVDVKEEVEQEMKARGLTTSDGTLRDLLEQHADAADEVEVDQDPSLAVNHSISPEVATQPLPLHPPRTEPVVQPAPAITYTDTPNHHAQSAGDGPPPAKKFKRAIFPAPPEKHHRLSLPGIPEEIRAMICMRLPPPSLVSLAMTCSTLYKLLDSTYANVSIWLPARNACHNPMPGPCNLVDAGWGVSRNELSWARWIYGGGKCVFCGSWTDVPPACFSLNIHVCLMECRADWRKQTKRTLFPLTGQFGTYKVVTCDPKPGPGSNLSKPKNRAPGTKVHAHVLNNIEDENHGQEDGFHAHEEAGDSDMTSTCHKLAPFILENESIHLYVLSQPALHQFLLACGPLAQDERLLSAIADARPNGNNRLGIDLPDEEVCKKLDAHAQARRRKAKRVVPSPQYLGEVDSILWPCEELRQCVANGMTFIECGPRFFSETHQWGLAVTHRRKYRIKDLEGAVNEWIEAEATGMKSQLIQEWERRAAQLEDKITYCQMLMRWRDECKQTLDQLRHTNDLFLRRMISAAKLHWHDASNSPTLVRMRNLAEVDYYEIEGYKLTGEDGKELSLWNFQKNQIGAESTLLYKRRVVREIDATVRASRAVALSFYRYCTRHAMQWGIQVLPPFRIFRTFPTVQTLPVSHDKLDNWEKWLGHIKLELKSWEHRVRDILRQLVPGSHIASGAEGELDPLDWASSLFRCSNCDAAVEGRTDHAVKQTMAAVADGRKKRPVYKRTMPNYKAPMTWKEIVEHQCEARYNVIDFHLDVPAMQLAKRACMVVGRNGQTADQATLAKLGKEWSCNICDVRLDWTNLYPHSLRHVWSNLHCSDNKPTIGMLPGGLSRDGIHSQLDHPDLTRGLCASIIKYEQPTAAKPYYAEGWYIRPSIPPQTLTPNPALPAGLPIPPTFCKNMKNATAEERSKTQVMCAHCVALARGHVYSQGQVPGVKVFGFDGLKDHLGQKHRIANIQSEDIILLKNALNEKLEARHKSKYD